MPAQEVVWSQFLHYIKLNPAYYWGNGIGALLFLLGVILTASAIKRQLGGEKLQLGIRTWIASGFVFVFLHEIPEIMAISGMHGGFPTTLYGHLHILLFQPLGGVLYFLGGYLIYREVNELY